VAGWLAGGGGGAKKSLLFFQTSVTEQALVWSLLPPITNIIMRLGGSRRGAGGSGRAESPPPHSLTWNYCDHLNLGQAQQRLDASDQVLASLQSELAAFQECATDLGGHMSAICEQLSRVLARDEDERIREEIGRFARGVHKTESGLSDMEGDIQRAMENISTMSKAQCDMQASIRQILRDSQSQILTSGQRENSKEKTKRNNCDATATYANAALSAELGNHFLTQRERLRCLSQDIQKLQSIFFLSAASYVPRGDHNEEEEDAEGVGQEDAGEVKRKDKDTAAAVATVEVAVQTSMEWNVVPWQSIAPLLPPPPSSGVPDKLVAHQSGEIGAPTPTPITGSETVSPKSRVHRILPPAHPTVSYYMQQLSETESDSLLCPSSLPAAGMRSTESPKAQDFPLLDDMWGQTPVFSSAEPLKDCHDQGLAASFPYLDAADLGRAQCTCRAWRLALENATDTWRLCIRARNGVPDRLRASFYMHLLYDQPVWLHVGKKRAPCRPNSRAYGQLGAVIDRMEKEALHSQNPNPRMLALLEVIKTMEVDLERTWPGMGEREDVRVQVDEGLLEVEEMRVKLRRILRAFAAHSPRVLYCQGINFTALELLEAAHGDDETAFWVLAGLCDKMNMEGMWCPALHRLKFSFFGLEKLLDEHAPALMSHFREEGIGLGMFSSRWFISLFCSGDTFGKDSRARILDIFFAERWPFLFKLAIAVLQALQDRLLAFDFEQIMQAMACPRALLFGLGSMRSKQETSLCERIAADNLIDKALELTITGSHLRELEAQFHLDDGA
jgi:23S rRNA maturation mini-RNase III